MVDQQGFVHTFENDAGEVIFTMPNGMQGYMLVNAAGNKVAVADTAIVKDIRPPERRGRKRHVLFRLPRQRRHDPPAPDGRDAPIYRYPRR